MPVGIDLRDAPDFSRLNAAQGLAIPGCVVILQAHLEVFPRALHRVDDAVALLDGKRQTLFTVNMSPTFECSDLMLRMKRKRSGDDHSIKVTRRQQLAVIVINRRVFFCDFTCSSETRFIHIPESGKANSGNSQECAHQLLATAARANNAEIDLVGRRLSPRFPALCQQQSTTRRCRAANKFASVHLDSCPFPFSGFAARFCSSPAQSCHCHCTNRCDSGSPSIHSPRGPDTAASNL